MLPRSWGNLNPCSSHGGRLALVMIMMCDCALQVRVGNSCGGMVLQVEPSWL